ncbi:uncharacterized protein LOC107046052 isoform X2 [Diachasma alloeum]|uniref:uncharacterized protein LOC107046052 isoform X2 n=1 Tax=Diachasma alloeum TaxID=454923 RepID=UPI000738176A|nr:uncharacterized protein LOC107046052 isoform X2 [Diachasma alloeum]
MPNFDAILSKDEPYNRLIKCIVSNSYFEYFDSRDDLPIHVINTCLNASAKTITLNEGKRIVDFLCQVELYRDTILNNCKLFTLNNTLVFDAPRKHLEAKIFSFLDSKRHLILRRNKRGQLPKSVSFVVLKQAAIRANKLELENNSTDYYNRYIYSIYTAIGKKWWRSRVLYEENVEPVVPHAIHQNSIWPSPVYVKEPEQSEIFSKLPLKRHNQNYDIHENDPTTMSSRNIGMEDIQTNAAIDTGEYQIIAHDRPSLTITITKRPSST